MRIRRCLISKSDNLEKIVDLGMHPYADTFISEEQIGKPEPSYPLQCYVNRETGQVQVGHLTEADERYNLHNYSYTSSNSSFARNHWKNYADNVVFKIGIPTGSTIIEIGSNDGYLCKQLQGLGYKTYGVDSSRYMSELAASEGVPTYCGVFDELESKNVRSVYGKANLIIANNVFNHSNDPIGFAKGVHNLLEDDGLFVYELPYWLATVKTRKFDQIYHEHVSYFTVKSSFNLLARTGFEIVNVEEVDYHGGCIRVTAKKLRPKSLPTQNEVVRKMIQKEEDCHLFEPETYKEFTRDITTQRDKFLNKLYKIRTMGHPIIGVGAAAKGNTFLNFYNLDNTVLEYVTDSSIHKQGKYTPLTRIPIVGDEIFASYEKVYALILSWNISDIIKENLNKINNRIEFLEIGEKL